MLAFKSQRSSLCQVAGWGPGSPIPLQPFHLGVGEVEISGQHKCTKKKKGSKFTIILENKEKPVSRESEVDLPCILTIYGVLMGLFKSCFTLLFNKKHIYHSNHLGREEHILPPRWRPPSKRDTAGICNVIFCATYNVGGRGGGGGSEGGSSGVLAGGGSARFNVYF